MDMVDINDTCHFTNPWLTEKHDGGHLQIEEDWQLRISQKFINLLNVLGEESDRLKSSDISMYTGLAGIAYFYHHLATVPNNSFIGSSIQADALEHANRLTHRCLRHVDVDKLDKNSSLLTSSIGALYLGNLLSEPSATEKQRAMSSAQCVNQMLNSGQFVCRSAMPDEALYGRTGYLLALLHLAQLRPSEVPLNRIETVVNAIISSGEKTANDYRSDGEYKLLISSSHCPNLPMPPLMFEWHEKAYLGGAHGFAGILLTLIKTHQLFPSTLSAEKLDYSVLPTVRWLAQLQFPHSGNWPSSLGRSVSRDQLVHWCHGATGLVPLMLAAYQLTGDKLFLQRAKRGGEAIWARGLLHKGCGLCHGSAGSGYALLDLYRVTSDKQFLLRAMKFAEWCTDCFEHRTHEVDRPYSLFEGLAGTLYFLLDVLIDPKNARFPLINGI